MKSGHKLEHFNFEMFIEHPSGERFKVDSWKCGSEAQRRGLSEEVRACNQKKSQKINVDWTLYMKKSGV